MLQRALGLEVNQVSNFTDRNVIPQWAIDSIDAVASEGFIAGYKDGTFRSEASITRAELAVIVARVLGVKSEAAVPFKDASTIPSWAQQEVAAVTELGLIEGRNDGRFDPNATATRAEEVIILLRLIDYKLS